MCPVLFQRFTLCSGVDGSRKDVANDLAFRLPEGPRRAGTSSGTRRYCPVCCLYVAGVMRVCVSARRVSVCFGVCTLLLLPRGVNAPIVSFVVLDAVALCNTHDVTFTSPPRVYAARLFLWSHIVPYRQEGTKSSVACTLRGHIRARQGCRLVPALSFGIALARIYVSVLCFANMRVQRLAGTVPALRSLCISRAFPGRARVWHALVPLCW